MNNKYFNFYLERIKPVFFFLALLWIVFLLEQALHLSFVKLGVYPRTMEGLLGVFTSPFIHGDLEHIFANSVSLFTLMSLLFYAYRKVAKEVFSWIYFLSGIYVWIFARPSYHIGASGIVYGLIGFLILSGILSKNVRLMALSLLVIVGNAGFFWGIFPLIDGVSWESHMSGLVIGLILALFFKQDYKKVKPAQKDVDPVSTTSDGFYTYSYTLTKEKKEKTVGDKNPQ